MHVKDRIHVHGVYNHCSVLYLGIIGAVWKLLILLRATYQWAPIYGSMRTWVEGSQARENLAWAEASKLFVTRVCKLLYRLYFY